MERVLYGLCLFVCVFIEVCPAQHVMCMYLSPFPIDLYPVLFFGFLIQVYGVKNNLAKLVNEGCQNVWIC